MFPNLVSAIQGGFWVCLAKHEKLFDMDVKDLRILFVHSGADLYGASRSLLRLSSRLVLDGAAVKVVLPYDGPLVTALEKNGVDVVIHSNLSVIERQRVKSLGGIIRLFVGYFASLGELLRLTKQFRPTLIHTMTAVIPSPGMVAKLRRIPHLWHVRESFGEFGSLWRYYQKYMIWLSERIICVSTPIAEQFDPVPRLQKVLVIHNGFPRDEFAQIDGASVEAFRSQYVGSGVKYLVGVVGRIKYQRKGQEYFVQAAALLRERFPSARFLCVGSPFPGNESHLTNLLGLIHDLELDDYVLYTGEAENIKAAIAGLDVLVLASAQPEPFAGVVVEAMALSRPVVATAVGGSIEQVEDGVTGYLVPPADPSSMAAAIEKLLQSRERMETFGKNGYKRFLQHFEFEPFYQRIVHVYCQTSREEHKPE